METTQPRLHTDLQLEQFHAKGLFGKRLLVDFLDENASTRPEKTAIIEAHRTLTYREIKRLSENLAASLIRLGVQKGDVVAIQAPNWAELPIVHFATNRIGAIFVPLSEGFRERELLHLLQKTRAKVVFCPDGFRGFSHAGLVDQIRAQLPDLKHLVVLRQTVDSSHLTFDELSQDDAWRTEQGEEWLVSHRAGADDPSHVMVSSGTTGLPRCSLYSDNNSVVKLVYQYEIAARANSNDIAAAFAPAGTGSTGYNYPILCMLLIGGTSAMLEHWNGSRVDQALRFLERYACTTAVVVPAQLTKLVHAAAAGPHNIKTLRVITNSGAKLPPSVAEAGERVFGCRVQGIYGTSEAGATAMTRLDDADDKRRTSVGRILEGQEVRIWSDHGQVLASGEVGEVCWRGTNKSFGFLNDLEGTRQAWAEGGWLHSGDLGYLDSDGYLFIVGRKKDMIIRGGQNINPGAIEEVLLKHPGVSEIAIVPFEDEALGERIAACVVPMAGATPSLDSLKALILSSGMAVWHQPEMLVPMKELPRNAGGKIDKKALSKIATAVAAPSSASAVPAL